MIFNLFILLEFHKFLIHFTNIKSSGNWFRVSFLSINVIDWERNLSVKFIEKNIKFY